VFSIRSYAYFCVQGCAKVIPENAVCSRAAGGGVQYRWGASPFDTSKRPGTQWGPAGVSSRWNTAWFTAVILPLSREVAFQYISKGEKITYSRNSSRAGSSRAYAALLGSEGI